MSYQELSSACDNLLHNAMRGQTQLLLLCLKIFTGKTRVVERLNILLGPSQMPSSVLAKQCILYCKTVAVVFVVDQQKHQVFH